MENFEGWTASAYWKGIELKLPNEERVKKVALVGNTKWKEQFTEVLIPLQGHILNSLALKKKIWPRNGWRKEIIKKVK